MNTAAHTRTGGDGFVTVIVDLTPVLDGTRQARLLGFVVGRSAYALRASLSAQSAQFHNQG
jgi:hypothetical protein